MDKSLDKSSKAAVIVIVGCLVISALRSFIVSSLESASSFLLETKFGWDHSHRTTGAAVGATFLSCIPAKLVHGRLRGRLATSSWIRVLTCTALLGSTLFHTRVTDRFPHSQQSLLILIGDAVVFSCIYLADGLSVSVMAAYFQPQGTWLDSGRVMLVFGLLNAGVGRTLGPWWSRFALASGGQDFYATTQTALITAFLLGFEVVVRLSAEAAQQRQ